MAIGNLINRFSGTVWAIKPSALESMVNVLISKDSLINSALELSSKKVSESKNSFSEDYDSMAYLANDNTLVINIQSTLMSKASGLDAMCGMTGYNTIRACLESNKDSVDNILFDFDTPGGDAIGVELLAEYIKSLSETHYTAAINSGSLSSAGYFLASACDEIYVQDHTVSTGCVGCVMCHVDKSLQDANSGLKYTFISTGDLKTAGNEHEALRPDIKEMLQSEADAAADRFVSFISGCRPFTEEQITEIRRGGSYTAEKALSLGLIDGIKSLRELVNEI